MKPAKTKRAWITGKKALAFIIVAFTLIFTGCKGEIKDGVSFLEEKKYDKAAEAFRKDIDRKRNLKEAYRGLGIACFEMGEYEDAANSLKKALESGADRTAVLYGILGACYMETEQYGESLDAYEKALTMPDITEEIKQETRLNLIAVYEKMGDWDKAKSRMEAYRKDYPDDKRVEKEAGFLKSR